jgi:hypothetical protein
MATIKLSYDNRHVFEGEHKPETQIRKSELIIEAMGPHTIVGMIHDALEFAYPPIHDDATLKSITVTL